ncbi:helix-turn-helix domain-containing protein [Amycolatopsis orientalis]|uniref:helix-turn-helix domain-containing protein n=1 Tax=Amycolatopsis orientalis TaxID=31958 RepID=UPI0003A28D48|nr:helix-turn-helix domain-containing protein [Amycolatopsis orientalis]
MTDVAALVRGVTDLAAENRRLRTTLAYRERANRKRLTPAEVAEIRRLAETTSLTQREIAASFDVNPATVSRIVRGIYYGQ